MENYFEKLEHLQKEVMESNLTDATKQEVISALREKFFDKAREQGRIERDIEFINEGRSK